MSDAPPPGRPIDRPRPTSPPTYVRAPGKRSGGRAWSLHDVLDGAFFAIGAVLVLWLAWVVLVRDASIGWPTLVAVVAFWLLLAYVGLPRVQEILAHVYVPDYFIGRTTTGTGQLGDPVNLAFDADAGQIHRAMTEAGWTRADRVTLRSSWRIIVSSVFRRSYPAAPVSPLLLFDRAEDFAYEQEVDGNASQRHHVRFWRTPDDWTLPGGYRCDWLAAATYDRAVGLSLFTLQVTHKVDADIDVERDYVVDTLRFADPDVAVSVIDDFSTAFHTRNGGGDVVHTDGALPVVDLRHVQALPDPVPPPATDLGSRRLPSPTLWLSGLMSTLKAVVAVVSVIATQAGRDDATRFETVTMIAGAVAVTGLWALVLARRRWARTVLMAVCAYEATTQLASLSSTTHPSLSVLVSTGISVLILIAVSSTDARRWVDARHPTGDLSRG